MSRCLWDLGNVPLNCRALVYNFFLVVFQEGMRLIQLHHIVAEV